MSTPKSVRSFGTTANGSLSLPQRSASESSIPNIRSTSSKRTSSSGLSQSLLRRAIPESSSTNSIDLPKPGFRTTNGNPSQPRNGQKLATLEFNSISAALRDPRSSDVPSVFELYSDPGDPNVHQGLLRRRIAEGQLSQGNG